MLTIWWTNSWIWRFLILIRPRSKCPATALGSARLNSASVLKKLCHVIRIVILQTILAQIIRTKCLCSMYLFYYSEMNLEQFLSNNCFMISKVFRFFNFVRGRSNIVWYTFHCLITSLPNLMSLVYIIGCVPMHVNTWKAILSGRLLQIMVYDCKVRY